MKAKHRASEAISGLVLIGIWCSLAGSFLDDAAGLKSTTGSFLRGATLRSLSLFGGGSGDA